MSYCEATPEGLFAKYLLDILVSFVIYEVLVICSLYKGREVAQGNRAAAMEQESRETYVLCLYNCSNKGHSVLSIM